MKLSLEKLKNSKSKLDQFMDTLTYEEDRFLLNRIRTIAYDLKLKIKTEEEILSQSNEIELPSWVYDDGYHYIKEHNGITYALHKYHEDKDGSFHVDSYAFVPNKSGYISFCVRMLGKDRHGDRIWTNSTYYKTHSQWSSYYSKDYGKNQRYPDKFKEYVDFILEEFNKLEEVNGNFKPFKSKGE